MDKNIQNINNLAKNCVQNEVPHCVAACPLHVDIKALTKAVAGGDFTAGRQLIEKKVPFAGILCRICEAPCTSRCSRNELDSAVQVRELERACMDFGSKDSAVAEIPPKKWRVAVVGGGLSGLCVTATLLKRGYSVTIFEASSVLGGRRREDVLLKDVWDEELVAVAGAQVIYNTVVGNDVTIEQLLEEFGAAVSAGFGGSRAHRRRRLREQAIYQFRRRAAGYAAAS